MMQGKDLSEVGELPGMPQSNFYDTERAQVAGWDHGAGYAHYQMDYQP